MSRCCAYVGRFAPSPTGDLHDGSVVAALASWLRAAQAQGQWLLRIEDIDPPREIAGAAQRILTDLHGLGLQSARPVLWQSQHHARYRSGLQQLIDAGHAFPCWCTRTQIAARGGHHGVCEALSHSERAPAWRLRVDSTRIGFVDQLLGEQSQQLGTPRYGGDFVIWRSDDLPAYQLAVVLDDAWQGITEVVRGADLLDSTGRQILLQRLLGLPTPAYVHVPLVMDAGGQKLSKQLHAPAIARQPALQVLARAWLHLRQPPLPAQLDKDAWLHAASIAFELAKLRQ